MTPPPDVEVIELHGVQAPVEVIETASRGTLDGAQVIAVGGRLEPGGSAHHTHTQVEPATDWVVDHNLGRYPTAWSLFDASGALRDEFLVETPTVNRAVVRMDTAAAGVFRCI